MQTNEPKNEAKFRRGLEINWLSPHDLPLKQDSQWCSLLSFYFGMAGSNLLQIKTNYQFSYSFLRGFEPNWTRAHPDDPKSPPLGPTSHPRPMSAGQFPSISPQQSIPMRRTSLSQMWKLLPKNTTMLDGDMKKIKLHWGTLRQVGLEGCGEERDNSKLPFVTSSRPIKTSIRLVYEYTHAGLSHLLTYTYRYYHKSRHFLTITQLAILLGIPRYKALCFNKQWVSSLRFFGYFNLSLFLSLSSVIATV